MEDEVLFCRICGKQLTTIDEIGLTICCNCKTAKENITGSADFYCWACGKELSEKSEIAQGICHSCKASINRKIGKLTMEH